MLLDRLLDNARFSQSEATISKKRSEFSLSHEHYLTSEKKPEKKPEGGVTDAAGSAS